MASRRLYTFALAALFLAPHLVRAADPKAFADTSRVVSIGGDVTEILYAMGLQDRIVAVDTTSKHPPEAMKEKASVGYMRALSTEGVLSLNPSVILASEDAGPPDVVAALKAASIPYVAVTGENTAEAVADKVRLIAKVMGAETNGGALASRVRADFEDLAAERQRSTAEPRVLVVLAIQNGRAVVGGRGSSADAMLTLAGARNAADTVNGFKPVTDEAGVDLKPDAIVFLSRAGGEVGKDALLDLPWVKASPAGAAGRIVEMDAAYLLSFGPRAPAAARDLMRVIRSESIRARADAGR